MGEIVKSIKAFLYDRTVSPLFGAFIAAWSVCNYRIFVALLDGDASLSDKIKFLDEYFGVVTYQFYGLSFQVWGQVVHGIFWPGLLAIFYIYGYPFFAKPVYEHSLAKQRELKDIKQKAENIRLLTIEESRNLIKEIEQLRYSADEEAKKYRERIASLTETINTLEQGQNSNKIIQSDESSGQAGLPMLDIEAFKKLCDSKVEALPEGEFEISDIFERDGWTQLDVPTRKRYGKLFKSFVDAGEIENVTISRKGTSNQQIYQKTSGLLSKKLEDFKNNLAGKFNLAFGLPENKRDELLNKSVAYCVKNEISVDMLTILLPLIFSGAQIDTPDLRLRLDGMLSSIEIDHIVKKLKDVGLVISDDYRGKIILTDPGKAMAVDSGLAEIARLTNKVLEPINKK